MIISSRQQKNIDRNLMDSFRYGNSSNHFAGYLQKDLDLQLQAMTIRYPVIMKLIGRDNFNLLVSQYLSSNEQAFTNTDNIGSDFDKFLENSATAQKFPYLPGIANLEWLVQSLPNTTKSRSRKSKNRFRAFLSQLFKSASEFNVSLSPNVALVRSDNGEVEIWLAHQTSSGTYDLSGLMSSYWVVERTARGVSVTPISQNDFMFCRQLKKQVSIEMLRQRFGMREIYDLLVPLMESKITRIV